MSLVGIFGDTQIEDFPSHDEMDEHGESVRFKRNISVLKQLLGDLWAQGCRVLAHLGDLTEKAGLRNSESAAIGDLFGSWVSDGGLIIGIVGNHDLTGPKDPSTFSAFWRMTPDKFIFDTEIQYHPHQKNTGFAFLSIPYQKGMLRENLKMVIHAAWENIPKEEDANLVIFAHYGWVGAVVGPNNTVLDRDYLDPDLLFPEGRSAAAVFVGHIHKPQEFVYRNTKILQVGSPIVMDMGERDERKYAAIYNPETRETETLLIPQPNIWKKFDLGRVVDLQESYLQLSDLKEPGSILAFKGVYKEGNPREIFLGLVKEGLIAKPFGEPDFRELAREAEVAAEIPGFRAVSRRDRIEAWLIHRMPEDKDELLEPILELMPAEHPRLFSGAFWPVALHGQNIFSFETLDHEFSRDIPTMIWGKNGSGKTNFLDAMILAISGDSLKGLPYSDVVRIGANQGDVSLELTDGDKSCVISRAFKRDSKGKVAHSLKIEVIENGERTEPWKGAGNVKIQDALETVLGVSFNTVRYLNFLLQLDHDNSRLVNISPKMRGKHIMALLGHEAYLSGFDSANKQRLQAKATLDICVGAYDSLISVFDPAKEKSLQAQVLELGQSLPALQSALKVQEDSLAERKGVLAILEVEISAAQAELQGIPNTEAKVKSLEAGIVQLKESHTRNMVVNKESLEKEEKRLAACGMSGPEYIAQKTAEVEAFKVQVAGTAIQIQALRDQEDIVNKMCNDHRTKAAVLNVKLSQKDTEIKQLRSSGTCPTCGSKIAVADLEEKILRAEAEKPIIQTTLDQENAGLAAKLPEIQGFRDSAMRLEKEKEKVQENVTNAQQKADKMTQLLQVIQSYREQLAKGEDEFSSRLALMTAELDTASMTHREADIKKSELTTILTIKEASRKTLADAMAPLYEAVSRASEAFNLSVARCRDIEKSLTEARETSKKIEDNKGRRDRAEVKHRLCMKICKALDPASGIPYDLMRSVQYRIESGVTGYIAELGRPDLHLHIGAVDGDEESLALTISMDGSEDGGPSDIRAYSGGQHLRMEAAFKMTFLELLAELLPCYFSLLLLDEPETGLEDEGKRDLAKTLVSFHRRNKTTLVCISHDARIRDSFPNRIQVVCDESKISRLVPG